MALSFFLWFSKVLLRKILTQPHQSALLKATETALEGSPGQLWGNCWLGGTFEQEDGHVRDLQTVRTTAECNYGCTTGPNGTNRGEFPSESFPHRARSLHQALKVYIGEPVDG